MGKDLERSGARGGGVVQGGSGVGSPTERAKHPRRARNPLAGEKNLKPPGSLNQGPY